MNISVVGLLTLFLAVFVVTGEAKTTAFGGGCPFRVGLIYPNLIVAMNLSRSDNTEQHILMKLPFDISSNTWLSSASFDKKYPCICESPLYIRKQSSGMIMEVDWMKKTIAQVVDLKDYNSSYIDFFDGLYAMAYHEGTSLLYAVYVRYTQTEDQLNATTTQLLTINPSTHSYEAQNITSTSLGMWLGGSVIQGVFVGDDYLLPFGANQLFKYNVVTSKQSYVNLTITPDDHNWPTSGLQYDPIAKLAYGIQNGPSALTSEVVTININNGTSTTYEKVFTYQAGTVRSAWLDVPSRLYYVLFENTPIVYPSYNMLYVLDVTTWQEVVVKSWWKFKDIIAVF